MVHLFLLDFGARQHLHEATFCVQPNMSTAVILYYFFYRGIYKVQLRGFTDISHKGFKKMWLQFVLTLDTLTHLYGDTCSRDSWSMLTDVYTLK